MDPVGEKFRIFSENLVKTLARLMEPHVTPRISVDEIVYVTSNGGPAFYSEVMKERYFADTGQQILSFRAQEKETTTQRKNNN